MTALEDDPAMGGFEAGSCATVEGVNSEMKPKRLSTKPSILRFTPVFNSSNVVVSVTGFGGGLILSSWNLLQRIFDEWLRTNKTHELNSLKIMISGDLDKLLHTNESFEMTPSKMKGDNEPFSVCTTVTSCLFISCIEGVILSR